MTGYKMPAHDLIIVDRPKENVETFTYYLQETVVLVCTVTYADASRRDVVSVEYDGGE